MEIYERGTKAGAKPDGSPVTEADIAAEAVILEGLETLAPCVPVVAEEAVSAGKIPAACDRYFLVDPLDGTREFVSRNGEFTVNIALIEAGVPVAGVVYAPVLGVVYWGEGSKAFKASVDGGRLGESVGISAGSSQAKNLRILASRSHMDRATASLMKKVPGAEIVTVGSSLKLCWLAEGKADLYPRLSPTMQWDIAAGDAVLRSAGGTIVEAEGRDGFAYRLVEGGGSDSLRNCGFLAVADPELIRRLDI